MSHSIGACYSLCEDCGRLRKKQLSKILVRMQPVDVRLTPRYVVFLFGISSRAPAPGDRKRRATHVKSSCVTAESQSIATNVLSLKVRGLQISCRPTAGSQRIVDNRQQNRVFRKSTSLSAMASLKWPCEMILRAYRPTSP